MLYILIIILVLLDQKSKTYAVLNFKQHKVQKKYLTFFYVENKGAALGFLKKYPLLLKVMNTIILVVIFYFMIQARMRDEVWIYPWSLGIAIAGGLGNVIDRYKRGFVIDFFSPKIKKMPYFNMADLYIFIGVIGMLISTLVYDVQL